MGKIKVLLDTNIVIDYFTGRMGDGTAERIVAIGQSPEYELVISMLTAINTMYVAKKCPQLTPQLLENIFHIEPQTYGQWEMAKKLQDISDFEDAMQIACAVETGCTVIISRDRHFRNSPITAMEPLSFVEMVS